MTTYPEMLEAAQKEADAQAELLLLRREVEGLRGEVRTTLLADEERRKLTGDAIAAEAERDALAAGASEVAAILAVPNVSLAEAARVVVRERHEALEFENALRGQLAEARGKYDALHAAVELAHKKVLQGVTMTGPTCWLAAHLGRALAAPEAGGVEDAPCTVCYDAACECPCGTCVSRRAVRAEAASLVSPPAAPPAGTGASPEAVRRARNEEAEAWLVRIEEIEEKHAAALTAAQAQVSKLQAFKDYVHRRLDEAGVPTHPDGPHSKEGCRVGDRLDIVIDGARIERDRATAARAALKHEQEAHEATRYVVSLLNEKLTAAQAQVAALDAALREAVAWVEALAFPLLPLHHGHGGACPVCEPAKEWVQKFRDRAALDAAGGEGK